MIVTGWGALKVNQRTILSLIYFTLRKHIENRNTFSLEKLFTTCQSVEKFNRFQSQIPYPHSF